MHSKRKLIKFILSTLVGTLLFCTTINANAETKLTKQPEVRQFIQTMVSKYNFNADYLRSVLSKVTLDKNLVENKGDHVVFEQAAWYEYRALFINPQRLQQGLAFWKKHQKVLALAQKEYGVPASIIVAIVGMETNYGDQMGDYPVLNTLATMAFLPNPRQPFYQKELADYFLMTKQFNLDPFALKGSYAGAMGMCQFMPSSMIHYAVAFSGNSKPNLFANGSDVVFSVGNFMMQHGWIRDQPIADQANVQGFKFNEVARWEGNGPQVPKLSLAKLRTYDIYPEGDFNPHDKASFMVLKEQQGDSYWVGFHNFYVITRYNNSNLYAMVAYQFSQLLDRAYYKNQTELQQKPAHPQLQQKPAATTIK